jgi:hypothetical protein
VSEECPGDVAILELLYGDFTSESTVWFVENILSCNLEAGSQVLTGEKEVKRRWCNNNLCLRGILA